MIPMLFYLGAFALFTLGAFFNRKTSLYTSGGGAKYESRRKRKLIGQILICTAAIPLVLGLLTQIFPSNPIMAESHPADNNAAKPVPSPLQPHRNIVFLGSPPAQSPASDAIRELQMASELLQENQTDAALARVNAILLVAPRNSTAYALRGTIYAQKKLWERAENDYQAALQIDTGSIQIKFNLAEMEFTQKKYDAARARFATLQKDPNIGDLAAYKVFLCDLFNGHEDNAAKELAAFNHQDAPAPSYYFANAAWFLNHQKRADALDWLKTAQNQYPPDEFKLYSDGLINLVTPTKPTEP